MFTKKYSYGRLSFEVQITPELDIELVRLPILPTSSDPDDSYHTEQMCRIIHLECPADITKIWADQEGITVAEWLSNYKTRYATSGSYSVLEYVGRESSSENLTPDTALDGFLEWELNVALELLNHDHVLSDYIKTHYGIRKMLTG